MITQIAMWAAKAAADKLLQGKHKDIHTRHRGDAGVEHHGHNGHSPIYTYAEKVKSNIYNSETFITEMKDRCKANIIRDRQNIQMEKEDNQTVRSLQFCYLKKCIDESLEEWMKWVRVEAEKCEYIEQDRQIKEQFKSSLDNEGLRTKIINEIKDKSKTDIVTSKQVLVLAKKGEANMMQRRGAEQIDAETMRTSTCKYCGSSHTPMRCPAYGMTCGKCSQVNHFSAVCRAPR